MAILLHVNIRKMSQRKWKDIANILLTFIFNSINYVTNTTLNLWKYISYILKILKKYMC